MTVLVKDLFTDANGTLLTAHTPDVSGSNWIVVEQNNGAPTIQSNSLKLDGGAGNGGETSIALPKAAGYGTVDYIVRGNETFVTGVLTEHFITGRVDTAGGAFKKYSFGWYRNGIWQLRKYFGTNQQWFQLAASGANFSVPFPTGTRLLEMRIVTSLVGGKPAIQCKVDGVVVISTIVDNDIAIPAFTTGIAGVVGWNQDLITPPSGLFLTDIEVDTIPTGAVDVLVSTNPGGAIPNVPFTVQPSGKIADAYGTAVTGQADNITCSVVSGPGTLSGTTTVAVNTVNGLWAFTNLQLSAIGTYTLQFVSANGYATAFATITVVAKTANFSATILGSAMTDAGMVPMDAGVLEIRDGIQPASTSVAATGTVGARVVLENPATWNFVNANNSVVAPPAKVFGIANITPTWARLYKSDGTTVLMDVTCGPSGVLMVNSGSTISIGQRVQLEFLTFTDSSNTITIATTVAGEVAVGGTLDSNISELPRTFLSSALPTTAQTKTVGPVGRDYTDLQVAITTLAASGIATLLLVDNGIDYTPPGGNGILLPAKGTAWLWICAHDMTQIPYGTRVTPALAASQNLPKIRLDNGSSAMTTTSGSQFYRITGFEILPAPGCPSPAYTLLNMQPDNNTFGGQGNLFTDMPHHIFADRNYIHGDASTQLVRGIAANADNVVIVENCIDNIHHESADAQGIGWWMPNGPHRITNNTIKGTGQAILIGGAESKWGRLPSDVEIRYNTLTKDPAWFGVFNDIKTIMEMKCGRRVIIEGNEILYNWNTIQAGWHGACMTFKTVNQDGEWNVPYIRTSDVTMKYNRIQYAGSMVNIHPLAEPTGKPATPASRFVFRQNLGVHMGQSPSNEVLYGMFFDTTSRVCTVDVLIDHNTLVVPAVNYAVHGFYLSDYGSPASNGGVTVHPHTRWAITNNIFCIGSDFPIHGRDFTYVDEAIAYYLDPNSIISRNLFVGGQTEAVGVPITARALLNQFMVNTTDPTYNAVGFTSISTDNYIIAPGSNYKAPTGNFHALDNTDLGVDIPGLLTALAGQPVLPPTPNAPANDTKTTIRTLEVLLTTHSSNRTVAITGVNYYRTDYELLNNNPYPLVVTPSEFGGTIGVPQTSPYDIFFGELMPAPNKIRITATIQP